MAKVEKIGSPKYRIKNKIYKYFIFTIMMSWSPVIVNYFISCFFNVAYKKFFLYKSEICFMTIVLVSNNIKDLTESRVLKRGKMLFNILLTLNILNIVFSILFFAVSSFLELTGLDYSEPEVKQFWFAFITYILAAIMGLAVQIGGGLDG